MFVSWPAIGVWYAKMCHSEHNARIGKGVWRVILRLAPLTPITGALNADM